MSGDWSGRAPDSCGALAWQDSSPWRQPKIRYGIALGLGVKGPDEIDVRAEGVDEIAALRRLMA